MSNSLPQTPTVQSLSVLLVGLVGCVLAFSGCIPPEFSEAVTVNNTQAVEVEKEIRYDLDYFFSNEDQPLSAKEVAFAERVADVEDSLFFWMK